MSDDGLESSVDEEQMKKMKMLQKKKKRLYTPKTRAKRIVTAGPSQDPQVPIAESELLDFRNRVSPPTTRETVPVIPTDPLSVTSEYDASCESLEFKTSDHEPRDNAESEATLTLGGLRCQERITNDDPQEGLPPSVDAHLSFDAGYLASSDSFSTSDIHDVVARYTRDPDVSQWTQNKNPEIRIHHKIFYDQPLINRLPRTSRAADSVAVPPGDTNDTATLPERTRLNYREVGATSSGGSVFDSSESTKQEPAADDSQSDVAGNRAGVIYDDAFEDMLITRIQNRIRELGGVGELELSDEAGLTPAGHQVKQRFGFLMRDVSDEEAEEEQTTGAAGGAERSRRRRRRRTPDWLLTDAPSDETLCTDLDAPPSTVSLGLDYGLSEPPPPRYSRSPDSESDVSALRAIRAEGGDQFVEAVLWRLHESLRAGNNFREYRESTAAKGTYNRRLSHHETSSDDDSDALSSRSSTGRVQFKDRVLVRPLGRDPLLTEYRRPYSKVSKQKLSSLKEYKPEPDDPDYEDSLKDRTESTAAKPPAKSAPAAATPAPSAQKPQPGWKKLFCCISGGSADDAPAKPAAAVAPPPPAAMAPAAATPPPPPAAPASPEVKRKRRRVKALAVQELDPDIANEELRSLHMMFDDRVELCSLSGDPSTEASLDEPSELSDPESDAEPCFSDFLKACGLKEDKINEYMQFYKIHRGLTGSGHGDWTATRQSPDGRPASVSSTEDPSWWDKRARGRRHEFRRRRREHHEYQRQLETQRDLEVEGQLRRALETQRELLREREVERDLERTRESSKDRKELRIEEEVLEKELLRRLLAQLQNEQVRSREREKRRTVARILEEELITRLTLELARQREKSEERRGMHDTQRMDEDADTRELNNRIEELRMRIEENKILRDYERDEEQERLTLLEELLVKERRRMGILETSRLQEQDQETKTRTILTELEEKSGEDEAKSHSDYEYCAKTLLKKNELHKAMRQKLTTEIRKRELVKRKLVSLADIEKSNPRLFQLAKVMEEVTDERGCLQLEYTDPGFGILKKDSQVDSEGEQIKTEGSEGGQIKTEEGADENKEVTSTIEETAANIKQEPLDDNTEDASEAPVEADGTGRVIVEMIKTEVHAVKPESSSPEDTGGETDLELPRQGETSDSNEDTKPPVPQSEAIADPQPSDELSDGEAPPPLAKEADVSGEVEVKGVAVDGEVEVAEGAGRTEEQEHTGVTQEPEGEERQEQTAPPTEGTGIPDTAAAPESPVETTGPAEPAAAPESPVEATGPAEPAAAPESPVETTGPAEPAAAPESPVETTGPAEPAAAPESPVEMTGPAEPAAAPESPVETTGPAEPAAAPESPAETTGPAEPAAAPESPLETTGPAEPATAPESPVEATGPAEPAAAPESPVETTGPAEPAADHDDAPDTVRFKESGVQVNTDRASPVPGGEAAPAEPAHDSEEQGQTDGSGADSKTVEAVAEPSPPPDSAVHGHTAEQAAATEVNAVEERVAEPSRVEAAEPVAVETEAAHAAVADAGTGTETGATGAATDQAGAEGAVTAETAAAEAGANEERVHEAGVAHAGTTETGAAETGVTETRTAEAGSGEENVTETGAEQSGETGAGAAEAVAEEPVTEEPHAVEGGTAQDEAAEGGGAEASTTVAGTIEAGATEARPDEGAT